MKSFLLVYIICIVSLCANEWKPILQIRGNHGVWTYGHQIVALKTEGFFDEEEIRPRIYIEISDAYSSGPGNETATIDHIAAPLAEALSMQKEAKGEGFSVRFNGTEANITVGKRNIESKFSMTLNDSKILGERLNRLLNLTKRISLADKTKN